MNHIKGLKKNVVLAKYTTYKIGGPADYFFAAKNIDDLKNALRFADDNNLSIFILAGGSNVLFNDEGFRGLVIKIENKEIEFGDHTVRIGAGVLMNDLVSKTVDLGLKGLEWAGGLPGTLGGAIRGNAGCFGGEIKDIICEVETVTRSGEIKLYKNKDCQFSYRDSIFKHSDEIIWDATLNFEPGEKEKLKAGVFDHIKYRQERHPLEFPNCGSVFKNCPLEFVPDTVRKNFRDKIKTDPFPILPTAALLSAAGLKGLKVGGAVVSEKHPNFIINHDNASAADIIEIIGKVKEKIKSKFSINLTEEIELVGFN